MLPNSFETIHFDSIESTNTYAKEQIRRGRGIRCVLTAASQTGGRGRGENAWKSPVGGLYLTVAAPVNEAVSLSSSGSRVAIKVVSVLADHYGVAAAVKWPNDLLVDDKKLAGVLMELVQDQAGTMHLVVGLGCNVNVVPPRDAQMHFPPTSLCAESGKEQIELQELASTLALGIVSAIFEPSTPLESDESVLVLLKRMSATIGREVTLNLPASKSLSGIAIDINSRFALLVEHDGLITEVEAGDCFHTLTSQ